jgi:hypothetical protein
LSLELPLIAASTVSRGVFENVGTIVFGGEEGKIEDITEDSDGKLEGTSVKRVGYEVGSIEGIYEGKKLESNDGSIDG